MYFEYFHANYPFLEPKSVFLKVTDVVTDYPLLHALFSIGSRFLVTVNTNLLPAQFKRSPHLKAAEYWIDRFEKHENILASNPVILIKSLLIMSISNCSARSLAKSVECILEAYKVSHDFRIEKMFSQRSFELLTSMETKVNTPEYDIANPLHACNKYLHLFRRESLIRTIWNLWSVRIQLALHNDSPDLLPPFDGDNRLPISDKFFTDENFTDWYNISYYDWRELEADLLPSLNTNDRIPDFYKLSGAMKPEDHEDIPDREYGLYSDCKMAILCIHILSLSYKLRQDLDDRSANQLDIRFQMLYKKLPPLEQAAKMGPNYVFAYACLFSTLLFLHLDKISSHIVVTSIDGSSIASTSFICAFIKRFYDEDDDQSPSRKAKREQLFDHTVPKIRIRSKEEIDEIYSSQVSISFARSYLMCQWATHCLFQMLFCLDVDYKFNEQEKNKPADFYQTARGIEDAWLHLSPTFLYVAYYGLIMLTTEAVLQSVAYEKYFLYTNMSAESKSKTEEPKFDDEIFKARFKRELFDGMRVVQTSNYFLFLDYMACCSFYARCPPAVWSEQLFSKIVHQLPQSLFVHTSQYRDNNLTFTGIASQWVPKLIAEVELDIGHRVTRYVGRVGFKQMIYPNLPPGSINLRDVTKKYTDEDEIMAEVNNDTEHLFTASKKRPREESDTSVETNVDPRQESPATTTTILLKKIGHEDDDDYDDGKEKEEDCVDGDSESSSSSSDQIVTDKQLIRKITRKSSSSGFKRMPPYVESPTFSTSSSVVSSNSSTLKPETLERYDPVDTLCLLSITSSSPDEPPPPGTTSMRLLLGHYGRYDHLLFKFCALIKLQDVLGKSWTMGAPFFDFSLNLSLKFVQFSCDTCCKPFQNCQCWGTEFNMKKKKKKSPHSSSSSSKNDDTEKKEDSSLKE